MRPIESRRKCRAGIVLNRNSFRRVFIQPGEGAAATGSGCAAGYAPYESVGNVIAIHDLPLPRSSPPLSIERRVCNSGNLDADIHRDMTVFADRLVGYSTRRRPGDGQGGGAAAAEDVGAQGGSGNPRAYDRDRRSIGDGDSGRNGKSALAGSNRASGRGHGSRDPRSSAAYRGKVAYLIIGHAQHGSIRSCHVSSEVRAAAVYVSISRRRKGLQYALNPAIDGRDGVPGIIPT